jgi:hypothetical protein
MPNLIIDPADAIAAELNDYTFTPPLEFERTYADWSIALENASTLRGDVVPVQDPECELETRGSLIYRPRYDIVLRKKFAPADLESVAGHNERRVKKTAVDPLVNLLIDVNTRLAARLLANDQDAVWEVPQIVAVVVHKHLKQWHQYTGIIRLTYAISQDLPA